MSARPEIGLLLPNTGRSASGATIREFAGLAEDAGVDSLWVGDHIGLSAAQETEYPYADVNEATYEVPAQLPFLEAFTSLGFAAAVTQRCRLGLGVGILPYRHPMLWAKLAGTLQVLSDGRFDFGVGAGWMREEFEALDADYPGRGAVSNEILQILQALRDEPGPLNFSGERFRIQDMELVPSLGAPWTPPIWVGGNGRAAAERVVRFGDVWYPHVHGRDPEQLGVRLRELQDEVAAAGREVALRGAVHAPLVVQSDVDGEPWVTGTIAGPPAYVADLLHRYHEAGIHHLTLTYGGSPRRRIAVIEEILTQFG